LPLAPLREIRRTGYRDCLQGTLLLIIKALGSEGSWI